MAHCHLFTLGRATGSLARATGDGTLTPWQPCAEPVDKTPKSVDMYIFHPENNFDIGGQDLGNAAGDTAFTCIDVLLGAPGSMDHSCEDPDPQFT